MKVLMWIWFRKKNNLSHEKTVKKNQMDVMEPATSQEESVSADYTEHLSELFTRLQKAIAGLKKREQQHEKESKAQAEQVDDLKQKITKLLDETASMKADREQLRQQVKNLEGRNHNLQKHIDQVGTRLDAAINKIGELID